MSTIEYKYYKEFMWIDNDNGIVSKYGALRRYIT